MLCPQSNSHRNMIDLSGFWEICVDLEDIGQNSGWQTGLKAGDMCEYLYELRDLEYPKRDVFATTLEFGTYGPSLLQRIHSLRTMIFESQLHWYGSVSRSAEKKIRHEFHELYFPQEAAWRQKAISDCRQALAGILSAHDILAV